MPDISEHPQFSDLKRLLRKLEKAEVKPGDPLSSLIRQPSLPTSPPSLPGPADVVTVASPGPGIDESPKNRPLERLGPAGDRSVPAQLNTAPAVRRSVNGRGLVLWIVLPLAAASLAAAVGWAERPSGLLAWPQVSKAPHVPPVTIAGVAASPPGTAHDERKPSPAVLPPASSAEPNDPKGPDREPLSNQALPASPSSAEDVHDGPNGAEPPASPGRPATRVSESNADAPLLGGRDKFELEARLDAYLERGQKLLDDGDITGARSFFGRVADSGDARGALAMGATYDPNYVVSFGIRGLQPDPESASRWYRRAMDLGSKDALDRLDRLGDRPK